MTLRTAAITLFMVAAVGCASVDGPASAAPTIAAVQMALGSHAAGRYTHSEFSPRIEVDVPDGWQTYHLSPDFFDVGIETDEGPVVVTFLRPQAFVTPEGERAAASPEDAIELLAEHPGVSVLPSRPVEIDGVNGLEVDVSFAIDDTHVMRVTDGLIGFGPQTDVRLAYLQSGEDVLVIGLLAPAGMTAEAESLTQSVRDSIEIDLG